LKQRTIAQEWQVVGLSSKHPISEIVEITGLERSTVRRIRAKYHVVARFGRQHAAARRWAYDHDAWTELLHRRYHEQGLPMYVIAQEVGVSPNTLSRRMAALGIRDRTVQGVPGPEGPLRPTGRARPDQRGDRRRGVRNPDRVFTIMDLVEQGKSYQQVADEMNTTVAAVKMMVYRARSRRRIAPARTGWTPGEMERMIELREAGVTNRDIAPALGVSRQTVGRWFREAAARGWPVPPLNAYDTAARSVPARRAS
jgi:uncharacterized protein YerC